jgi:hypothetical protein
VWRRAERKAERAEDNASSAIAFTYDAIDYAESAVLNAIVARADADTVQQAFRASHFRAWRWSPTRLLPAPCSCGAGSNRRSRTNAALPKSQDMMHAGKTAQARALSLEIVVDQPKVKA